MVLLQEKMMIVKVKNYVAAKIVNQQTITVNELSMYCALLKIQVIYQSFVYPTQTKRSHFIDISNSSTLFFLIWSAAGKCFVGIEPQDF